MAHGTTNEFLIAGLGASAGGLEAFEKFFRHMPVDARVAIIVVQHLAPDHTSALPELLGRCTAMPVEQARDGTKVLPGGVYIIPPNATLTIRKGTLHVASPAEPRGHRMPIDSLFRSLAEDRGENAVCIMLSGTGTDGTIGLRAIKEHGGMAIAQTLESAQYDTILRSAISTGLVDHVLPVEDMPAKLLEYAAHLKSSDGNSEEIREQIAAHKEKIYSSIRRRAGHDFSQYKQSTITRRLQRRMKALQIETVEEYVEVLERQPEEADRLFKDLLIGVTQFFRDEEAFEKLGQDVIPKLFEGKDAASQVRACVVGCATGEEAYSIAILLCEHAATLADPPKLQVFATDIDDRGLEMARKGRYPESIAEHVSPQRLERFFMKQENAYQVNRKLREICIFSNHSFIKDPPFSRLDLISCRNVMIYLGLDLQRRIIPIFHYALRAGGYLFLGPSESVSLRELFRTVNKTHRIFQRKQAVPRPGAAFPLLQLGRPKQPGEHMFQPADHKVSQLERIILQRYRPACVVVQENGDAVYFSGRTGRYLEPASGSPNVNVINMAREGLRIPLRMALHKAVTNQERVVQKQVPVQTNGAVTNVDLTIEPIAEVEGANFFMVVFEDAVPAATNTTQQNQGFDTGAEETIRHLEGELRTAQEHAQAVFEELESSNEELKSANEEYQSTNEELETSKEEVQSFNEELETVNAELNRRVAELDHLNSDLQNLNASTQIATIFLDGQLNIKNFTPAAGSVFRLIAGDVGRPITDLAARFANADFADDIQEVLRTLVPRERELPGTDQKHYLVRILPYRTVQNVIDGVVITFTDVTELKQADNRAAAATQAAEDARVYAENIIATVREPLLVLDAELRVKSANTAFYETFAVLPEETINRPLNDLGNRQWDIPDLRLLLRDILPAKKTMEDFCVAHEFEHIGKKVMMLNAREILQQNGGARLILLAIEDVSEHTYEQNERRGRERHLTALLQERESLVREMHHRVKNNLQAINSLLSLQAEQAGDDRVGHALTDAQRRVRTIAQIHEALYAGKNLAEIEFGAYLTGLLSQVQALYSRGDIAIDVAAEPILLPLETAVPLALIANELITNSFKHAFPGERGGTISVTLSRVPQGAQSTAEPAPLPVQFVVRDDGIGFPPQSSGAVGFGLDVIAMMVEQLQGKLERRNTNGGAYFCITFSPPAITAGS